MNNNKNQINKEKIDTKKNNIKSSKILFFDTGPIITLVNSPDLNTGNKTRQIQEWNAMRYFVNLRQAVGNLESYGMPIQWMYFDMHEDLNQTSLGDLVIRNSHELVERPQVFILGGGSESPLERGLGAKGINLDIKDVDSVVRRHALWVERKILGEE